LPELVLFKVDEGAAMGALNPCWSTFVTRLKLTV
jgi:hypothetical protein